MKFLRTLAILAFVGIAHAAGPVYNYVMPGGSVNALYYNVKCDGSTDDYANLNRAMAAVPAGGTLFIPPSPTGTACLLSQALVPSQAITIQAQPGTVTLKPTTGNTSNPVLLSVSALSGVSVKGITFDGGGTSFANTNNVVTVFNSSNVTLDGDSWQNTRGIAVLVSASTNTGVKNSSFSNIGNYWQTSGLSTDRHQAIAFCCSSPTQPQKNYATGNYFTSIGLDSVSATNQLDFLASGNRCQLSTAQTAQAFGNWPACVYGQNNTEITVTNNISDSAPGNGIDMASGTTGAVITGNYVTGSGGAGVSIAGVSNFEIAGNELTNNGSNTSDCHRDGIDFLDAVSTGTVGANTITDTRGGGSKTQQYGMFAFTACSHVATLTNVTLDQYNQTTGNAVAAYGGGISAPSAPTILYARTAREISASITPTAYNYPEGDATRYGADPTGVADSTTAIQNAISVMSQAPVNGKVTLDPGTYLVSGSGLTLANNVAISGYGAVLNYTGTGYAIHTPSTGVTLQPGVLGLEIDIGASAAGAMSLASSVHGAYRDIRIAGTSSTSAIAILLGVNTSGTTNEGNRNTVFNEFDNILVASLVGTGVRFIGDATVPTVVTLNTFVNFNISGSGNAATYGIEFNSWADSNRFSGVTRVSLQNVASAASTGVIFNSGTPASNVGIYAETFDHLAVDCFGSPSGDARKGIVYNDTKQNKVDYFYQYPECAGGPIVKNGPVGSNYVYHVTDNTATVSELLMQSGSVQFAGIANVSPLQISANTTTGQALGPVIYAGTNTADFAFSVKNAANTTQYMQMRGDGALVVGPTTVPYEGAGTIDASTVYNNGTPVVYYPVTSTETSCGATVVDYTRNVGNILRYGTNTTPGTTDMTTALTAALCSSLRAYVPAGTYLIGSVTFPNTTYQVLEGDGPSSQLVQKNSGTMISWSTGLTGCCLNQQGYIKNLAFVASSGTADTIYSQGVSGNTFQNLYFTDVPAGADAIHIDGKGGQYMHDFRAINIQIYYSSAGTGNAGIEFGSTASDSKVSQFVMNGGFVVNYDLEVDSGAQTITLIDSHPYNAASNIVKVAGSGSNLVFTHNTFDNATNDLVSMTGSTNSLFADNYFESVKATKNALTLTNTSNISLINNMFNGASGSGYTVNETGTTDYTYVQGGNVGTTANWTSGIHNFVGSNSVSCKVVGDTDHCLFPTIAGSVTIGSNLTVSGGTINDNNGLLQGDGTSTYLRNASGGGSLFLGTGSTNFWNITSAGRLTNSTVPTSGDALVVGAAANASALTLNGNSTTGQSLGEIIKAGTNSSDYALKIANQANTTEYARVYGDGGMTLGTPTGTDEGAGTLNATNLYVNGTAVSTAVAANPTGTVGLSAVNGTATTWMRSDASPPLSQSIAPTWTGGHTFTPSSGTAVTINAASSSFGMLINSSGSTDGIQMLASTGNPASVKLRGNNNAGSAALQLQQDSSNIVHLSNLGNAAIDLDTNGSNRIAIFGDGGVNVGSPTGGDKGAGTLNVASGIYSNNNLLQSVTGTYTGTLTGVSGTVTGTVHYRIDGQTANLWVDADITGTSNANTLTITGGVAAMEPAANRVVFCGNMEDNSIGNQIVGQCTVSAAGVITLAKLNSTPQASSTNWTTSGTKGVNAGWSITYPLQ